MHPTTEQSDAEFLAELQRIAPATIQQLCDSTGVTANAVRQRLTRLESRGLVQRQRIRQERGRPMYGYSLTSLGLRRLGDDYAELALLLWKEIRGIEEVAVRDRLMGRIREALVKRLGSKVTGLSALARTQELSATLSGRGLAVEVEESTTGQLPILREHSCPYHELAAEDSSICEIEQSVFAEVLGMPVELSACRLDGHRCCEFQVGIPTN